MINKFVYYPLIGLNVIFSVLMLVSGYSYMSDPATSPKIAASGLLFPIFLAAVICFLVLWVFLTKWRFAVISAVTVVAGVVPIWKYVPLNIQKAETGKESLRILSWNVHNFCDASPEHEDSFDSIVNYLATSNAKIVCMQEANLNEEKITRIKKYLPNVQVFQIEGGSGLACASVYPITKVEGIKYDSKANGSACFFVKTPSGTLRVVNNHFQSLGFSQEQKDNFHSMVRGKMTDEEGYAESKEVYHYVRDAMIERAPQARAVADYVGKDSKNTVVVGDFNDTPISYTHYTISQVLKDCYAERGLFLGFSYVQHGMFVRIDHAFCSEDFDVLTCAVDNNAYGSDHYPITVTLARAE